MSGIKKYFYKIKTYIKIYILRDKFAIAAKKWFDDDGDNTLRIDYPLDKNSLVFDIGGYEGDFARKIYQKYNCNIFVFEPVKKFYDGMIKQFGTNKKIKIFNFGLSDEESEVLISVENDSSSIYTKADKKEKIILKSIVEFISLNKIEYINLMKINVEGGEYDILPCLIESKLVHKIENLQIQFHNFIPNAIKNRDKIRKALSETHELTYEYYFVWENWKIKNNE